MNELARTVEDIFAVVAELENAVTTFVYDEVANDHMPFATLVRRRIGATGTCVCVAIFGR